MKTKITFLPFLLMMFSSIFYSQDFNRVPAKTAVYDSLPEMKWHSETPMPAGRVALGIASYLKKSGDEAKPDTNFIFAIGGKNEEWISVNNMYKYNTVSKEWTETKAKFPDVIIEKPQCAQINGKIYIPAKTWNGSAYGHPLYIYDIENDTIMRGQDMPSEAEGNTLGVYGDSLIYIFDGYGSYPHSVQIYNIYANSWSSLSGFPIRNRSYINGAICGNTILLVGGYVNEASQAYSCAYVDIGTIDPQMPYTIKWSESEDYPGGTIYDLAVGSWNGKNNKYFFFTGKEESLEGGVSALWIFDIEQKKWFKGPDKISSTAASSNMTPIIQNDSVYMVVLGGWVNEPGTDDEPLSLPLNERLYIGPNDAMTADFVDVSAVSIDIDTAYVNDINIPKAIIRNRGLTAQKVNVTLTITPGSYSCEKEVNSEMGEMEIVFDVWMPKDAGAYNATITAGLASDQNLPNNIIAKNIEVVQRPMNPGWHSELGLASSTENLEAVYYLKKSGNPSIADTGYIIVFADLWEEGDGYMRGSISKYNTITRAWSAPDSSFIWVRYYHPVLLGGKIYFVGGQVEGTTCIYCGNELMIYDIEKDSVYYGSPMLKQCDSYAVGTFADSLIYILGGYSYDNNVQGENNGLLNLAQIYNVNTDTWSYGSPFPGIRRCKISGSISGSTVVLAGGYSEQGDASTVDIGVIDPADPSILNWWQKPFLNQMNLENFPGGKTQGLASGAWFGRDTKAVYFAEGRKIWQYNVSTGVFSEMPEKIYTTDKLSALMPIVRNDSVYLAMIGRDKVTGNITNEWYYIGNDAADPDIANEEEPNITAPKEYSLSQNYPNPFNPSTKIKYSLREPGHVSLTVYDMLGREIKTLINELMSAGGHEVIFNAAELNLSSGIYLYRIKSGSFIQTKKLMLIK